MIFIHCWAYERKNIAKEDIDMSTENLQKIHHSIEKENVSRAYTNILDALLPFKANEIEDWVMHGYDTKHITISDTIDFGCDSKYCWGFIEYRNKFRVSTFFSNNNEKEPTSFNRGEIYVRFIQTRNWYLIRFVIFDRSEVLYAAIHACAYLIGAFEPFIALPFFLRTRYVVLGFI